MALVNNSTYNPKYFFKSGHFNTVYRTLFQNIDIKYDRKRLELWMVILWIWIFQGSAQLE